MSQDHDHDPDEHGHDPDEHGHAAPHADHAGDVGGAHATMSARVQAFIARLEESRVLAPGEIDGVLDAFLASARPSNGAALVARAWVDPAFAARLVADASAAVDELGIDTSHWARVTLRAVANTAQVHNVVVCTLCSCYPVGLLGPSPGWYKSAAYRARVVREPRAVLAEMGVMLAPDVEIRVWDSTAELRYIVVPLRPAGTEALGEAELAGLVGRDALIGTQVCAAPS